MSALHQAREALSAIASHPREYNDGGISFGVGWAFTNVKAIATEALAALAFPVGDREAEDRFWLELREPGKVPQRKGSWPLRMTAEVLREFMEARPEALITVVTWCSSDGPAFQDAAECLEMADGRSAPKARRHRASSREAWRRSLSQSPASGNGGREEG